MAERTRTTSTEATDGFTAEERAAMKEHARELREAKKLAGRADKAEQERQAVLEKIAAMDAGDRALAERVHAAVTAAAPALSPKLWYGSPAYARDGKIICFFQESAKFKTRYCTLGFNEEARLDDGSMWPTAFALTGVGAEEEARIAELVARAVG